ncbi:MAG TPA: GIY-YIG nuclease family protein [Woeseiaceae bacterium]|nr:GIY-YIG nuclease family protein [Woeseiaceae bacterium]
MGGAEYSLYIVRCADGSLYTGIAIDVARRLAEHASGPKGARYLRGKGPLELVFEQAVGDRSRAAQAEYRVKRLDRAAKEALIAGRDSLENFLGTAVAS